MTATLGEVLEGLKGKTPDEALLHLKANKSIPLWKLLEQTLHPEVFDRDVLNVTWTPEDCPVGLSNTNLFIETRKLYLFKKATILPLPKKKQLLGQILESLDSTESGIFAAIIGGTFYNRYSNLDPMTVNNLITLP